MMRTAAVTWVVAVLAACSNLDHLDEGVCGNGVVELGEDCDGRNDRCVACGIRCDADKRCDTYPDAQGFVCGADDFCHAPGGSFREPQAFSVQADSLRVTDIDGDRIGDLLIQTPNALEVMNGAFAGGLATSSLIPTPLARGPASYAYVDDIDDAEPDTLDILLPTADGIVAYTSQYGVLSPYAFPTLIGQLLGEPKWGENVAPFVIAFIGVGTDGRLSILALSVGVASGPPVILDVMPLCGAAVGDFDADRVAAYPTATGLEVAVTLGGAAPRICLFSIDPQGQDYVVTELALTIGAPALRRPVLAPLRGACPSLVYREATGATVEYAGVTGATTACSFAPARLVVDGAPDATPVGWLPLAPALAGSDNALVFSSGVYAFSTGAPLQPVLAADRALSRVVFADLDDDQDIDAVAMAAATDGGATLDDLDVLYRTSQGFLDVRYDTNGPVRQILIGDFDGNELPDVAVVQARVRRGQERDELAIAFGTLDRFLPLSAAGTFDTLLGIVTAQIPDSNDQASLITDLVVLHEASQLSSVSLIHGSAQRALTSFFDPRDPPNPMNNFRQSAFRGATAGEFTSAGLPGPDLVAIDEVYVPSSATDVWLSEGPTGGMGVIAPRAAPMLGACGTVTTAAFCIEGARYVAWPGDERDRVIGLDVAGRVISFDPGAPPGNPPMLAVTAWPASTLALPAGATPRSLDVIRTSAGPRVVLAYSAASPGVLVCEADPAGQPVACSELGAMLAAATGDPTLVCLDATTAGATGVRRFTATAPGVDVIALCRSATGSVLYDVDLGGGPPVAIRPVENADQLEAGDVNGDSIDDVITIDRSTAIPTLRVYVQCTSRDLVGCVGPGVQP